MDAAYTGKGKLRIAIMQMAEEVAHKAGVGEWRPSYGSAFVRCRPAVVLPFPSPIIRVDPCICLRVLICLVYALC